MKKLLISTLAVALFASSARAASPVVDVAACALSNIANCPVAQWNTSTTSKATGLFSTTNAVELIVVLATCADFNSRTPTVTASGGSFSTPLTKMAQQINQFNASVWCAVTSAALTGVTFTLTQSGASNTCAMTVIPFSTALTTCTVTTPPYAFEACTAGSSCTNTEQITLTTSTNSLVVIQGSDNNSPATAISGTTLDINVTAGWTGHSSSLTSSGSNTFGTTNSRQWAGAAFEVCDSTGCLSGGGGSTGWWNWGTWGLATPPPPPMFDALPWRREEEA